MAEDVSLGLLELLAGSELERGHVFFDDDLHSADVREQARYFLALVRTFDAHSRETMEHHVLESAHSPTQKIEG